MIACAQCGKDVERHIDGGILINADGDFVCDEECKRKYEQERDYFFNHIITDDKKFATWLGVPESLITRDQS